MDQIVGIEKRGDGKQYLIIRLRSAPRNGEANKALIKFLSQQFRIPSSHISLKNGAKSHYKKLLVSGASEDLERIAVILNRLCFEEGENVL